MRPAIFAGAAEGDRQAFDQCGFRRRRQHVGGWLDQALDNGYEIIPIEPAIVKKLEQMGYYPNGAAEKAAIGSSKKTR